MKLLLGTTNPAKIEDYRKYLVHSNLELVTLKDLKILDEPLEIGKTYKENALLKAQFYGERSEYPTLGEDGGFEVEALDGRPGLESNRWLGPEASDRDKVERILEYAKHEKNRKASFKVVTCVYFPPEREAIYVESSIHGVIPKRAHPVILKGFPYRSIFYLPQFQKYYLDLTEEEHEQVNHRKQACKEMLIKLEPYLNS